VPEPTALAMLVAQSAAKAVGGMAVRASVPAWRRTVERLVPAPIAVRGSASWSSVKVARGQQRIVERYLASRLCIGLLEVLAYLELTTGDSAPHEREIHQLGESFRLELAAKLGLPHDQAARVGRALWSELHDTVRLQVAELRADSALADADLVQITSLVGKRPDAVGGSALAVVISERVELAQNHERVVNARAAVRMIGSAMRDRYAKLVMPHSREDYRVPIEDIYVTRTLVAQSERRVQLDRVAEADLDDRRFVILGNPGAGKSTFIRHLLYRTGAENDELVARAPMVLELKDHPAPGESYLTIITEQLRVITQAEIAVTTVRDILVLGLAVIVFDGLDEIADIEQRRSAVAAIEAFGQRYPLVRVAVTAREEGYSAARLDPTQFARYLLPDFTDDQVRLYVNRWFDLVAAPRAADAAQRAKNFLADSEHVGDLRTNPLMLSLLCMIYEYEGYIPENRPQVYEECAELLFERWDRVRRVPVSFKANAQTRYLVQELAYYFFTNTEAQRGETESTLRRSIQDYFQRNIVGESIAASNQAQDFLNFCAGRAWLLTQIGHSDRGERLFGFTHRTFMEYFAACYIVRHCNSARDLVNMVRPMIQLGSSEVVPQIAIQQFDARRADGIDDCIDLLIDRTDQSRANYQVFLAFALRSLRFMRPTPRTLLRLYAATIEFYDSTADVQLLTLLLAAPRDTFDLMERSCRTVRARMRTRDGSTRSDIEFGPVVVEALLRNIKDGADPARIIADLADGETGVGRALADALPRISLAHPDVFHLLAARQFITAADYVRFAGARALVSVRSGLKGEAPGPLVTRMELFFGTGQSDHELHEMLAQVPTSPDVVLPMDSAVVAALAALSRPTGRNLTIQGAGFSDALDDSNPVFNRRVLALQFPIDKAGMADWSSGFYLLYLGVMAAAYTARGQLGPSWAGPWRWIARALPGFGPIFLERATANRQTGELELPRAELADCVLDFLPQVNAPEDWQDWFVGWRDEKNSPLRPR
jgi:uncharacterized protein YheU (UPF0270 family)